MRTEKFYSWVVRRKMRIKSHTNAVYIALPLTDAKSVAIALSSPNRNFVRGYGGPGMRLDRAVYAVLMFLDSDVKRVNRTADVIVQVADHSIADEYLWVVQKSALYFPFHHNHLSICCSFENHSYFYLSPTIILLNFPRKA